MIKADPISVCSGTVFSRNKASESFLKTAIALMNLISGQIPAGSRNKDSTTDLTYPVFKLV